MEAGIPTPQQNKEQRASNTTTSTPDSEQNPPSKLPPQKQHTLLAALDQIAEEQESNDALVEDLQLQGTKNPADTNKFWEASRVSLWLTNKYRSNLGLMDTSYTIGPLDNNLFNLI